MRTALRTTTVAMAALLAGVRELIVDYLLDPNRTTTARAWFALCLAVAFVASASLWRRRPFRLS